MVTAGGLELVEGEYTLDTVVNAEADIAAAVIDGGFLVLDTEVTEELAAEGIARDMVRSIQPPARTRICRSRTGSAPPSARTKP